MRIQTILNRVEKFKSFVYDDAHIEEQGGGSALVVQVVPARIACPTAPVVTGVAALTIISRSDDSSSCPCGESWCSWPTGCGEWIAPGAG